MSCFARSQRRLWVRAFSCLCLSGVAQAQVPTQSPAPAPAVPALVAATPVPALADGIGAFEKRPPLTSTHLAGYSLERCLALTLRNYPRIHEARARLGYRREQQVQSWSQPYSEFNITGGLGLAPEVRGTPIYSPDTDVALSSHMGVGWTIGIDGVVPLWTFGKITNLWDASAAQVKVAEQDVEREKNNIKLDVRRAYYGVQLARDAIALMREAEARIDGYLGTLEKKVKAGDGDEVALYKLRISRADLTARHSEARQKEAIALASLKFLTGVQGDLPLPELPLVRVRQALSPLATYLSAARLHRPEINMAKAGLLAREAQVRLEQARYYPDLGLGLSARWSKAPGITDQTDRKSVV